MLSPCARPRGDSVVGLLFRGLDVDITPGEVVPYHGTLER
jgi:hypothetical protein